MTCFDRYIGRAIELVKLGYAMTEVTYMLVSGCGTTEEAHLVARAAQVFVRGLKRRERRIFWM